MPHLRASPALSMIRDEQPSMEATPVKVSRYHSRYENSGKATSLMKMAGALEIEPLEDFNA